MNRILSTQPLNRGERFTRQSAHVYINGFALPDEFSDTNGTLSLYGAEYSLLPSTSPQACSITVLSLGYVYQLSVNIIIGNSEMPTKFKLFLFHTQNY
jgi:hypothetical protein